MISVRNVCACSSLAGCLRALMVRVPSGPREDVTEVGSTSSGSWHLWVKVFITVPSVASCATQYRHGERSKSFMQNFILRCKDLEFLHHSQVLLRPVPVRHMCTFQNSFLAKVDNLSWIQEISTEELLR